MTRGAAATATQRSCRSRWSSSYTEPGTPYGLAAEQQPMTPRGGVDPRWAVCCIHWLGQKVSLLPSCKQAGPRVLRQILSASCVVTVSIWSPVALVLSLAGSDRHRVLHWQVSQGQRGGAFPPGGSGGLQHAARVQQARQQRRQPAARLAGPA